MAVTKVSPLAPTGGFPDLPVINGVQFATADAGVRYSGRHDVMLAELAPGSVIAGVFTKSSTRSAAVLDCQAKLGGAHQGGAAILVNSDNANAFTGSYGFASVAEMARQVALILGIDANRVFTASTGVIGEPLAHDKIIGKLGDLKNGLLPDALKAAACAIMTTDTFPKGSGSEVTIEGGAVYISGFAKGSGMIAPDMATMLAYIFTDAKISQPVLQAMLTEASNATFNCISVDSDTSTSDTLLLAATGKSDAAEISRSDTRSGQAFYAALYRVMLDLAHQVVRDGEGATKFVEVRVTGADTDADARKVAISIANSPLVKTAIAGEDPNWGRVVMAVGKSGAKADRDELSIHFGDILVAKNGWVAKQYSEEAGAAYMKRDELVISVDLGLDQGQAVIWTCDLTHRYIEINADYRS
ncbi:MAG: bifunctional glutamate N-acetyltransferase/amino-acid acetyltransferase ArgJ [Paracoccaceae bacterium]